jgi:S-adenosylmethionine:tRNA ribosyltransferase-isomerase
MAPYIAAVEQRMKDKNIPQVVTENYLYELPSDRIALHPLSDRDASRLLVASRDSLRLEDRVFRDLDTLLPSGSLLVVNDSRVLPARIACRKDSGGAAEILLLEPVLPSPNPAITLEKGSPARWRVLVGGKKIKGGNRLSAGADLEIEILEKEGAEALAELTWNPAQKSLALLLEELGSLPLPPYLKRELEPQDRERYQTVYARASGSVAAPTAGLHFTDALRAKLSARGVQEIRVTLHVGAGTFKPVESTHAAGHAMHSERFEVELSALQELAQALKPKPHRPPVVAVGTTSLRTLESLYWLGVRVMRAPDRGSDLSELSQWEAYEQPSGAEIFAHQALSALALDLERRSQKRLVARSRLMIVPGYRFQVADWLITNFHQPQSSLILLVAAWMGEDWRKIYDHALASGYRFLSYGDSSLLIRSLTPK